MSQAGHKQVSNTLTRWHKVAERIKVAADELQAAITHALNPDPSPDFDTFSVRKAALVRDAEEALREKRSLHTALTDTLYAIRRAVAHANVRHGVADILNDIERTKAEPSFLSSLIAAAESAMSVEEFEALGSRRAARADQPQPADATGGMFRRAAQQNAVPRVTFIGSPDLSLDVARRSELRVRMNALTDRLSEANATRIDIEVDPRVAALIGL